jgi:GT2 family glycosyltransferase
MTSISVVIPTRDRPEQLAACLDALAVSFPHAAETIVVSDGGRVSPDLSRWVDPLRLRLIEIPNHGPAAARNRGLAAASGDVVAFTDDDCRPRPGWLAALAAAVSPTVAAAGRTVNGTPNAYADAAQVILQLVGRSGREPFLSTTNIAFPTAALRELGGFDESFRTAEDRELCRRWRAAGLTLQQIPDAVVEHRPQLGLGSFVRKFYAYGGGARQFHTSRDATWGDRGAALRFHLGLPVAVARAARARGPVGGARLLGLVALWELANVAGFATGLRRNSPPVGEALEAAEQA